MDRACFTAQESCGFKEPFSLCFQKSSCWGRGHALLNFDSYCQVTFEQPLPAPGKQMIASLISRQYLVLLILLTLASRRGEGEGRTRGGRSHLCFPADMKANVMKTVALHRLCPFYMMFSILFWVAVGCSLHTSYLVHHHFNR